MGVKKGDRVAVSLGNTAMYASLVYACFKLGAVLVPLNPAFSATQLTAALAHLHVEVLVIGAATDVAYKPGRGRSNEDLLRALVPDLEKRGGVVESPNVPTLRRVLAVDNRIENPAVEFDLERFHALTPAANLVLDSSADNLVPDTPLVPNETINIQFTSGTTSQPKAAMLSHTNILNNGALIAHRMGLDPGDRIVIPPPLFHCFGLVLGYMATSTTGAAIMFPSPAFDAISTLKMASDHDATGLYGVSTMLVAYLDALDKGLAPRPPNLRKGIVAGSSVPEPLMRRVYERLGLKDLVICYGMTETSPVSCMTAPSDPFVQRCASVGRVMPHTAVKVVDRDDRSRILPVNTPGELVTGGYLLMSGYYGDPDKTAEVLVRDDDTGEWWMHTGDEAVMDADGYVAITGRIKDLILRGGENIHPLEVESCVCTHPGVMDVSVVGVPDDKYGEVVGAFVIRRDEKLEEDDVKKWVRDKMSSHLVPKYVFWIDVFPKTASGKVQKFRLREIANERLKRQEAGDRPR
jgi:acyl-CoA synthetase (AMP-forming)/AMP-acid ligase II